MKNGNGQDTSDPSLEENPIMRWTRTEFGHNSAEEVEAKKNELREQVDNFQQRAGEAFGGMPSDANFAPGSQSADMFDARVERNNTDTINFDGSSTGGSPKAPSGGAFTQKPGILTSLKKDGDGLESVTDFEEVQDVNNYIEGNKLAFGAISREYQMVSPGNAPGRMNSGVLAGGEDKHVTIDDKSNATAKFQTGSSFARHHGIGQASVTSASFANMKVHMQQTLKPSNVFLENLRKNINDSVEFVTYDNETRRTQFIVRDKSDSKPKSVFGRQFNVHDPEKPYQPVQICQCKQPVTCQMCVRQQQMDTEAHLYPSVTKQTQKQQKIFKKFLDCLMPNGKQLMPREIAELIEGGVSGGRSVESRKEKPLPTFKEAKNPGMRRGSGDSIHIDYLAELRSKNKVFAVKKEDWVFTRRNYNWLMMNLMSNSDLIKGCEVQIPEQVLYVGGAPRYFLKNDKEGCVTQAKKILSAQFMDVRRFIDDVHLQRARIRDAAEASMAQNNNSTSKNAYSHAEYCNASDAGSLSRGQTMNIDGTKSIDSKGAISQGSNEQMNGGARKKKSQQKNERGELLTALSSEYYKEIALQRLEYDFNNQKEAKDGTIMGESNATVLHSWEYLNVLRGGDQFWGTVAGFQVYPQNKIGLGKTFKFTFSPIKYDKILPDIPKKTLYERKQEEAANYLAEEGLSKQQKKARKDEARDLAKKKKHREAMYTQFQGEYHYNFKQFGDDDYSLQMNNPQAFCLKQCNKIGYFLQKVHEVEIVHMNVEFIQDETGLIQFYHASDLWVRCAADHQLLNMKPYQCMQPKKLEDTLLASAREREQLNMGIGKGGTKLGEPTRPLDWRLRGRRPVIDQIRRDVEEFLEANRPTYDGDVDTSIGKRQDFGDFIKKYNAEFVHREDKPPEFLCLDRDNNIYDLQELKAEYARSLSERAQQREAKMHEQKVRKAFEKHLVEEMTKRSQDSRDRQKTAERAHEKSETASLKSPMKVQESMSSIDSVREKQYVKTKQNLLQWLRAQKDHMNVRLSYQGDITAGASSYRNTAGLPTLELDQNEQDSLSKQSTSNIGPSYNSIISFAGPRNHQAFNQSMNKVRAEDNRTIKTSFMRENSSLNMNDSNQSLVDADDDEVQIAGAAEIRGEFLRQRSKQTGNGNFAKRPTDIPDVSRKFLIKGFEAKTRKITNKLAQEPYADGNLEPSGRQLIRDRSYIMPDESVQRHLLGLPPQTNMLNLVRKTDKQFLDAGDVSDLKVHADRANVRGLSQTEKQPKPRRIEFKGTTPVGRKELEVILKKQFQVNTKNLVVPAIRYASKRPLNLQEKTVQNVKSQQQLWSKARINFKRDDDYIIDGGKKSVNNSSSAVVLPAFRVNHQHMRDFESFKNTIGILQGRDQLARQNSELSHEFIDPKPYDTMSGAQKQQRTTFYRNARDTGKFSLGPSGTDSLLDYKKTNIAHQRAIIQRDLRDAQEKLGVSRNTGVMKNNTADYIYQFNKAAQHHNDSQMQSQLKAQKSMKAFKAMDLQDRNFFSDIKHHLDAQNIQNNNLLMNREQRDQTEHFMQAQLLSNIINPELSKATYHSQSLSHKEIPSSSLQISQMKQALFTNRKAPNPPTITDGDATTQMSIMGPPTASVMRSYLTAAEEGAALNEIRVVNHKSGQHTERVRKDDLRDMSEQNMRIVGQAL